MQLFKTDIRYEKADVICSNEIGMILFLSRASTVRTAEYMDSGIPSVTTVTPHHLQTGSLVLLSESASDGGGVIW
jgi:hypothetical protein